MLRLYFSFERSYLKKIHYFVMYVAQAPQFCKWFSSFYIFSDYFLRLVSLSYAWKRVITYCFSWTLCDALLSVSLSLGRSRLSSVALLRSTLSYIAKWKMLLMAFLIIKTKRPHLKVHWFCPFFKRFVLHYPSLILNPLISSAVIFIVVLKVTWDKGHINIFKPIKRVFFSNAISNRQQKLWS